MTRCHITAIPLIAIVPVLGASRAAAAGRRVRFRGFSVAREMRLLPGDWDARLTAAVAIPMGTPPLMVAALEGIDATVIDHDP